MSKIKNDSGDANNKEEEEKGEEEKEELNHGIALEISPEALSILSHSLYLILTLEILWVLKGNIGFSKL